MRNGAYPQLQWSARLDEPDWTADMIENRTGWQPRWSRNEMSTLYYIYALKDPRTSPAKPFYIGKGIGTRAWDHIIRVDETSKGRRISAIQSANKDILVTILADGLTEQQALKLE